MINKKREVSLLIPYTKRGSEIFFFLQKRTEDAPRLPGYFAIFGGGIEKGENPEEALKREIYEEMNFIPENYKLLGTYEFEDAIKHAFYLKVEDDFEQQIKINEGDGGKFFNEKEIVNHEKISEYDKKVFIGLFRLLEK